jgi:hypothetical protein
MQLGPANQSVNNLACAWSNPRKKSRKTRPERFKSNFQRRFKDSHALEPLIKVQRIRIDRLGVHRALVAAIVDHVGRRVRREIRSIVGRRDDGGALRRLIAITITEVASLIHIDPARRCSNMRKEISRKNEEKRAKSRAGDEKGDFWISNSDQKIFECILVSVGSQCALLCNLVYI